MLAATTSAIVGQRSITAACEKSWVAWDSGERAAWIKYDKSYLLQMRFRENWGFIGLRWMRHHASIKQRAGFVTRAY